MPSITRVISFVTSAALAAGVLSSSPVLAAQKKSRVDPDGPDPKVAVTIGLAVGAARYDSTGQGVCLEIPEGTIYGAPATLYSVRQTTDKQRLNMTLYRLKTGGDMLTLNVTVGKDTHSVSTVKVGESGVPLGSATAKLERSGSAGTLTIDATDPKGVKITGTVTCAAFNRPLSSNGL